MTVFIKDEKEVLIRRHIIDQQIEHNFHRSEALNLGIDGSTTSFGLAVYDEKSNLTLIQLMRDGLEDRERFMEHVFPFLTYLLRGVEFSVITYEKTPDDFETKTKTLQIMKETEQAVSNWVNSTQIRKKDPDTVLGVFPSSWKAFIIPKDIERNSGKTNKYENSKAVLQYAGKSEDFWMKELNSISESHMYDCLEAYGIGLYGSDYICTPNGIRVYRNFSRKRPLYFAGRIMKESFLEDEIKIILEELKTWQFKLYISNDTHSCFENAYGLDSNQSVGFLISYKSDKNYLYYRHLLALNDNDVLLAFTTRINDSTTSAMGRLEKYGYKYLVI
jgi:hypothetical protein